MDMAIRWQYPIVLNDGEFPNIVHDLHEYCYSDPFFVPSFHESSVENYTATSPCLHHNTTNLTPLVSDYTKSKNIYSEPSAFDTYHHLSSSFSEISSQERNVLLLPQPYTSQSQRPSVQTPMSIPLMEIGLSYPQDEDSFLWDQMQRNPEISGNLLVDNFDNYQLDTDLLCPNTDEQDKWLMESYQPNQISTSSGSLKLNVSNSGEPEKSGDHIKEQPEFSLREVNGLGYEYIGNSRMKDFSPAEDLPNLPEIDTANKTRIRWTQELHEGFVQAINDLGGPERATPKNILIKMDKDGLTICQVKSHLQKYRLARDQRETREDKHHSSLEGKKKLTVEMERETRSLSKKESETLHMQWGLQKMLHDQLKIIRALQIQTEENGKRLEEFIKDQKRVKESFMQATPYVSSKSLFSNKGPTTSPSEQPETSLSKLQKVLKEHEEFCNHAEAGVSFTKPEIELAMSSHKRARTDSSYVDSANLDYVNF